MPYIVGRLYFKIGEFLVRHFYTILLSLGAILVAFALGIFFGSLSATKSKLLHAISRVYVEFFQNTPLLIQFIVVYYGFPLLSPLLSFSITTIAILCVGLYHGAYISEVVRSGIGAVPRGQFEAAYSAINVWSNDAVCDFTTSMADYVTAFNQSSSEPN